MKVACGLGETTLHWSAVSRDACVCMPGYAFVDDQCSECSKGFYKASTGNADCTPCPINTTTFSSRASSNSSCVAEDMLASAAETSDLNESTSSFEVPAVSFSLAIVANGDTAALTATVASTMRGMLGTGAIVNAELVSELSSRRLVSERTLMITLRYPTMQEAAASAQQLDMNITTGFVLDALRQNEVIDVVDMQASDASVSVLRLECPPNTLVPPGTIIGDIADCVCSSGYSYNEDSKSCQACSSGQYKDLIGNGNCQLCPARKSTLKVGSTSIDRCLCQAGTFEEGLLCSDCKPGFFCPGTGGPPEACPPNTQSLIASAATIDSCLCAAGYFLKGLVCEPCEPGRFKGNVGNEPCPRLCPANAYSNPGAMSVDDCFCVEGYHAILASNGQLDRCASCASYVGLDCPGGFDLNSSNTSEHLQPRAIRGFYQTASTFATKCRVVLPDGSSACRGGNQCGEGTTGMLCGECPVGWARSADFIPCAVCWEASAVSLSTAVLFELTKIAALNFVLVALAAMDSANANLPLHTYMIRMFTQWLTACALITHFNLDLLETPFSQPAATGAGDCEEQITQSPGTSNPQIAEASGHSVVSDVVQQLRLEWPVEVSRGIALMFDILAVVPTVTSVKFSAQCRAFELFPGQPGPQRLAPAIYFISLPILTILATFVVCAVAAYVLVPFARRFGVHLNKVAKAQHKKRKQLEGFLGPLQNLPLLEIPLDLPRTRNLDSFVSIVESHDSFARELCRTKSMVDPQLDDLLAEVSLDLKTFRSCPTRFLLSRPISKEEMKRVSRLQPESHFCPVG